MSLACSQVTCELKKMDLPRYAVSISIKDAFSSGDIAQVFDCRDNSGSSV